MDIGIGFDLATRSSRHARVSRSLKALEDESVAALLSAADPLGSGIGGDTLRTVVHGEPVFIKRIRLTDRERFAENLRSTANVFGLPAYYHHGIGSAGFGAWRELVLSERTTAWVLAGEHDCFPILHHWRIIEDRASPRRPGTVSDHDMPAGDYWGGSAAVDERLGALARSTASLLLFSEFIGDGVSDWLTDRRFRGAEAFAGACTMAEASLDRTVEFLGGHGIVHFDAHLGNMLTDGHRVYLTDFGLATSNGFDLSPDERDFIAGSPGYDSALVRTQLLDFVRAGITPAERERLSGLIGRAEPVATLIRPFYRKLQREDRKAAYPAELMRRLLADAPG